VTGQDVPDGLELNSERMYPPFTAGKASEYSKYKNLNNRRFSAACCGESSIYRLRNPYLSAESLYSAISEKSKRSLSITPVSVPFFSFFLLFEVVYFVRKINREKFLF
jgi:hypothetical protein